MKRLLAFTFAFLLYAHPALAFKFASGSYAGNGSDGRDIDISDTTSPSVADFQPDFCLVKGNTTQNGVVSLSTMGADASKEVTTANNFLTDRIQTLNATGFQVGTNSQVNSNGVTYYYLCLATDVSADLAVGSYTGNGSDSRDIDISATSSPTVADFQPELVMIFRAGQPGRWRGANSHTGDDSSSFTTAADTNNNIQAFNATGFQVGTALGVNENAIVYHYLAIKAVANTVLTGTYTGNATDDRSIAVGFQPQFVLTKGASTTSPVRARFLASGVADESFLLNASAASADGVQAIEANGFQVGTGASVNEDTIKINWIAIKAPTVAPSTTAGPLRRRGG